MIWQSRSRQEDPEQARLKEKAKQVLLSLNWSHNFPLFNFSAKGRAMAAVDAGVLTPLLFVTKILRYRRFLFSSSLTAKSVSGDVMKLCASRTALPAYRTPSQRKISMGDVRELADFALKSF